MMRPNINFNLQNFKHPSFVIGLNQNNTRTKFTICTNVCKTINTFVHVVKMSN